MNKLSKDKYLKARDFLIRNAIQMKGLVKR
ncbi:hypothetical protein PASE110613_06815 [Paenibacillus sediminis]|uniref:Uncharacterized protein n=1 Tax=Paenibacillus sediminis TaxID=664909 RepID=A0ABS4H1U1_9BACL|nr:hypothetical protein [Paenibacillus sediminis]